MSATSVGVIGLGLLGSAIAERLIRADFAVLGYDSDPSRMQLLGDYGVRCLPAPTEVMRRANRIILSLPTSSTVESLLNELDAELRPGLTIVDTTTGEPAPTAALGARLQQGGVHYLDATISGSSEQVRAGDVIVIAGGDQSVCESCDDLFRTFARTWFHTGPCGSGVKMKLVVNLVLGLNRAALAEGLSFAKALGFDLPTTLEILQSSAAYSKAMDAKGQKMITQNFTPQARLSQHLKDVRLILAEANRMQAKVPFSTLHQRLLTTLDDSGNGELDNSAVIKAFE
jgi:3-hydroxyisobutyrate dehydrogenase-like beta-hydroxyacid dehydrogenase